MSTGSGTVGVEPQGHRGRRGGRRRGRTRRALLAGLAPLAGALGGACGQEAAGGPAPSAPPVEIEYWEQRTGETGERFVKAALTFNQQQSRAVLKTSPVPAGAQDLRAKLLSAAAGGAGPDVMLHNALEVSNFLGTGLLYDVDAAVATSREWAQRKGQLSAGTLAGHQWQGKLVTLPAVTSAIAVFYNKDLLQQANVPAPSPTWTWDAFVDVCRRVKQATGKWGCSFPPAGNTAAIYWHNWAACNNVALVDVQKARAAITTPEALEVSRFLEDVIVRQELWVLANITRDGRPPPDGTPFASGAAAFETQLPATLQTWDSLKLNVGVAPMPAKKRSSSYAIPDHTIVFRSGKGDREAAGVQFALWLARPESQVQYATLTNRSPVYADARRLPAFQQYLKADPRVEVFESAVPRSEPYAFFPRNGESYTVMGRYVADMLQGKIGLQAAHAQAEREIQLILDEVFAKK
jgi:multiple sugar transport system substrate-binding protein